MTQLTPEILERFVSEAADRLEGEWVVIGGSALPLMGAAERPTADIDVAGPDDATLAQTIVLLEIAEELGLPVESINQAGSFFLRRIEGWRDHVVPVRKGPRTTILRPDTTLFVLLKLARFTETDLRDCVEVLRLAAKRGEAVDNTRLAATVETLLQEHPSQNRLQRLRKLREVMGSMQGP